MNEFKKEKRGGICFYNCDNIEFMKTKPDNYYDLAIVDPPYMDGDNKALQSLGTNRTKYNIETFNAPKQPYFDELFRVSKNQIIWGGNYFTDYLRMNRCWLAWDKIQDLAQFSDFELAWTSFDKVCKKFTRVSKGGFLTNNTIDHKIHPTQKPVDLYRWQLQNYAEKGMKILDTHGGSMSIAKACDLEGFELDICEIDPKYFIDGVDSFDKYKRQLKLF